MTVTDAIARRWAGTFDVDPWGLDDDLLDVLAPLASLRWSISVEGEEVLLEGPALLVAPRRLIAPTESVVLAAAVRRATGRPLRVLGIPDLAPIGPVLRRLGGAVDHPAEARALLRAGHLVLARHDHDVDDDVRVVDVRTIGWELGRRWRVHVTQRS